MKTIKKIITNNNKTEYFEIDNKNSGNNVFDNNSANVYLLLTLLTLIMLIFIYVRIEMYI